MKPNDNFIIVRIDKAAQLKKRDTYKTTQSAWLGIHADKSNKLKIPGVEIHKVDKDSPAYKANFMVGDIITTINNKSVSSVHEVMDILSNRKPGDELILGYISSFMLKSSMSAFPKPIEKKIILAGKEVGLVKSLTQEMENNLQYGLIVGIGKAIQKELPEATPGDYLIFHHNVEGKRKGEGQKWVNDWHLFGTDKATGDEFRFVKQSELMGVIKLNPFLLMPHKSYVFCHYKMRDASFQLDASGLWLPDKWHRGYEDFVKQLEELTKQVDEIQTSTVLTKKTTDKNYRAKEDIAYAVNNLNREREVLSKKLQQKRLVDCSVLFFNPSSDYILGKQLVIGDIITCDQDSLYPLEIDGNHYALANVYAVEYLIQKQKKDELKTVKHKGFRKKNRVAGKV